MKRISGNLKQPNRRKKMTKQINKRWKSLLLVTIAAVIMLGASSSAFAQKSMTAKFPKPDFKAMEEYWEVVEYEYDYATGSLPLINVIAKKKQEKVPKWWVITWRDAKGVKILSHPLMFDYFDVKNAKDGEPIRASAYAPSIKDIPRIKSVVVTEHEDPNWGWNNAGANDTLLASLLRLESVSRNRATGTLNVWTK
jgi:hypothetical protein